MRAVEIKAGLRKHLHPEIYRALRKVRGYLSGSSKPDHGSISELALAEIGEPFAGVLGSIYGGEPQSGQDGLQYEVDRVTRISIQAGLDLYHACRAMKAQLTMEIGCAYGFSTLYFLAAHATRSAAAHVAIDPWENSTWHGIGVENVKKTGMQGKFRLIEEPSVVGIPMLMGDGTLFDVIFIDGNHRFDDVLVDFTLSARVCKQGGLIILDDMWMPSIRKAVSFVQRNRTDFEEVSMVEENLCAFRKIGEDKRSWTHFEDFR
jgi:predicted O-methyltransferase YrrM